MIITGENLLVRDQADVISGRVIIRARMLEIRNALVAGETVEASGSVIITAEDRLVLNDGAEVSASRVLGGDAGKIHMTARILEVRDASITSESVRDMAIGGDIRIVAEEFIVVRGLISSSGVGIHIFGDDRGPITVPQGPRLSQLVNSKGSLMVSLLQCKRPLYRRRARSF